MEVSTFERHALAMLRKPLTLKEALMEVLCCFFVSAAKNAKDA